MTGVQKCALPIYDDDDDDDDDGEDGDMMRTMGYGESARLVMMAIDGVRWRLTAIDGD